MSVNQLSYKGYTGTVEWSEESKVFHGRVLGIKAHMFYEGNNIDELRSDFINCIDEYIEYCNKNKLKPEKPYKGNFNVRVGSELHALALQKAEQEGISLNKLVCNALTSYLM